MSLIFNIKTGLQDFFRPFSVTILPTDTAIEQTSTEKAEWLYLSNFEIIVSAKNLERDGVGLQLGNVEREIMRMVCTYTRNSIIGIEDMFFRGMERIYGISDNYAKSTWSSRIVITVRYHSTIV